MLFSQENILGVPFQFCVLSSITQPNSGNPRKDHYNAEGGMKAPKLSIAILVSYGMRTGG